MGPFVTVTGGRITAPGVAAAAALMGALSAWATCGLTGAGAAGGDARGAGEVMMACVTTEFIVGAGDDRPNAETGTMINGDVSKELLLAIFNYRSPLHDGAAIIQADRLQAVGCLLPLSNDPNLAKILGTRHRAAVGLSEFTDAWVIVVSEETGSLSLARQGQLERDLTAEVLEERLRALYQARASEAVPA